MITTPVILYLVVGFITLGVFVQQDFQQTESERVSKDSPLLLLFLCILLWWVLWLIAIGAGVARKMTRGK